MIVSHDLLKNVEKCSSFNFLILTKFYLQFEIFNRKF
jgi:hypothetical protein